MDKETNKIRDAFTKRRVMFSTVLSNKKLIDNDLFKIKMDEFITEQGYESNPYLEWVNEWQDVINALYHKAKLMNVLDINKRNLTIEYFYHRWYVLWSVANHKIKEDIKELTDGK